MSHNWDTGLSPVLPLHRDHFHLMFLRVFAESVSGNSICDNSCKVFYVTVSQQGYYSEFAGIHQQILFQTLFHSHFFDAGFFRGGVGRTVFNGDSSRSKESLFYVIGRKKPCSVIAGKGKSFSVQSAGLRNQINVLISNGLNHYLNVVGKQCDFFVFQILQHI